MKDWMKKLISEKESRRREEVEKAAKRERDTKKLEEQWPAFASGLREEIEADVRDFNAQMTSQGRSKALHYERDGDSFAVTATEAIPPIVVRVVFDHARRRFKVSHSIDGKETSFECRLGNTKEGGLIVWETADKPGNEKLRTAISEDILQPLVKGTIDAM
jgi:hypothetical protein